MTPKPYQLSKTVWFNLITAAVAILTFIPTVSDLIPDSWLKFIIAAVGVLNIILRIYFTDSPTTKPLGLGDDK